MNTAEVEGGCRLAYWVSGKADGPAVVLSNALGSDHRLWDRQLAALEPHFRVVRYDTRGHGASEAPQGDYTIERLGDDVVALLDTLGIDRAHICGVSLGGLTAQWLAAKRADRVASLVLANTGARIGTVESWTERIGIATTQGLRTLAEATMGRWFTPSFREAEPDTVAAIRQTLIGLNPAGYASCCAALRDADLRPLAAHIKAPTLVITGTVDEATPPALGFWLAGAIPGAALVPLDAAHISNIEQSDAFNRLLLSFLVR
jgi:3-oxoadipate enol-lactonase